MKFQAIIGIYQECLTKLYGVLMNVVLNYGMKMGYDIFDKVKMFFM